MPNWCNNSLEVNGKVEKVKEFVSKFEKEGFDGFVPTPKDLIEHPAPIDVEELREYFIKKYGAPDWYEWRLKNWGTKWNPADVCVTGDIEAGRANVFFDTAWAPPIEFFDEVVKMYPGLEFILEYEEPGMGFFGEAKWSEGERDYDECYEWEQRFDEGWHLYRNMIDPLEEIDYLLDLVEDLDDCDAEKITKYASHIQDDEEKLREVLEVVSSLEVDEIKEFVKKIEKEVEND